MGLFGDLGRFVADIAKETIEESWNDAEARVEAIEEKKKDYTFCEYDLICDLLEDPDSLTDIEFEALQQVKEERDQAFEALSDPQEMSEIPDEWLIKLYENSGLWSSSNYPTAMRYIVEEMKKRGELFKSVVNDCMETYEDCSYKELEEYKDDTSDPIRHWVINQHLQSREESIEFFCNPENIEDMDNEEYIEELLSLKFYKTELYGERGEQVYQLLLNEWVNNRVYLSNSIITELQNCEEYEENLNFENKSNKWLITNLDSNPCYDLLDRVIMIQILNTRGIQYGSNQ